MKRILISLAVIGTTLAIAFGFSRAFFSDTETSSGNLFQAGKLDLKISNECHYFQDGVDVGCGDNTSWEVDDLSGKVFFNFLDIKPGDYGESTIDFWIDDNPGWICSELTIVDQLENEVIESEVTDEFPTQGELGKYLMWAWWRDDGDNVFETNETILNNGPKTVNNWLNNDFIDNAFKFTIADSSQNWSQIPGPILGGSENKEYLGFAWCFGNLVQNALTPSDNDPAINGTGFTCTPYGNENDSQTDSVVAQIKFSSEQHRNNPNFLCVPQLTPTPSPTPTATPVACVENYASGYINNNQGTRKDGSAVLANRSDPSFGFVPQTIGADADAGFPAGSFFSLGFGGNITYTFPSPIVDSPGSDLRIWETTGGVYPDEKLKVEVSQDGSTWYVIPGGAIRDEYIDISSSPLDYANYLKLTDTSDINLFENTADGYDLDGISTVCPE